MGCCISSSSLRVAPAWKFPIIRNLELSLHPEQPCRYNDANTWSYINDILNEIMTSGDVRSVIRQYCVPCLSTYTRGKGARSKQVHVIRTICGLVLECHYYTNAWDFWIDDKRVLSVYSASLYNPVVYQSALVGYKSIDELGNAVPNTFTVNTTPSCLSAVAVYRSVLGMLEIDLDSYVVRCVR